MVDVASSYQGSVGCGDPPPALTRLPSYYQSAPPPRKRKHSKSLNLFKIANDTRRPMRIDFNIEGSKYFTIGDNTEYFAFHIRNLIRKLIPPN